MSEAKYDKIGRILSIYTKLINGYTIGKAKEAQKYGVNERSIQRDIEDIRAYLANDSSNSGCINTIIYDRFHKGYRLEQVYGASLSNSEVLAVCKILLDSRAFTKTEMMSILDKLVACCVPEANKDTVAELIRNEAFHYVEPRHKKKFVDTLWSIGQAIRECRCVEVWYKRIKDHTVVKRRIKPVSIMFSEYYFYFAAFIEDEGVKKKFTIANDPFPTIYRIDRIKRLKVLDDRFSLPYKNRFEEGEFRKRVQFMYSGQLRKVKFKYCGYDIDAVLDRLPTATILSEECGVYTVAVEVFGTGIDMWLRSQGDLIEVIT